MKPRACLVPACNTPASDLIQVALCGEHATMVHQEVAELLRSSRLSERPNRARPQAGRARGIVYFMRFGELIKIGFTTNLSVRLKSLRPDEVLATMPGTMQDEKALHAKFGPHWSHGEYFTDHPEIRAFITGVEWAA